MNSRLIILVLQVIFPSVLFLCPQLSFAENLVNRFANAVVRIKGVNSAAEPVMGTGFLVESLNRKHAWLVTAAHILNSIKKPEIKLLFRKFDDTKIEEYDCGILIRGSSTNLYKIAEGSDIAAILISLPDGVNCNLLSKQVFARENDLKRMGAGMGSQLILLGYPYGFGFEKTGYSIARTGIISSYPLFPAGMYPCFIADFEVFPGFSGALALIKINGKIMVAGMVLEEIFLEELRPGKKNTLLKRHGLGLARVLHSCIIRRFIEDLD